MGDQLSVVTLAVPFKNLITPKPATWFEELFWGRRWVLTASYGDVGALVLPLYPLYFEHRDRVIRLAPDFSLIIANFADADHLRIAEIDPTSATRRGSRLRAGGEIVSLVLAPAEGVYPQTLRVHFSYFMGRIAWRPILVSLLFILLGNLAGIFIVSQQVHGFARTRLAVLRKNRPDADQTGAVLPRETLALIVPGRTTAEEVVRLCGPPTEEHEHLGDDTVGRRTIAYRGTRTFTHHGFRFGRIATVARRDEEVHEVDVELERGVVRQVQARIKRSRTT